MKKFVLALAAIAALSTAAVARADRADLRDLHPEWYTGTSDAMIQTAPFTVGFGTLTASERVKVTMERDEGGPR